MKDEMTEVLPAVDLTGDDDTREPRRYEIGCLLVPLIAAEQITQTVETLIQSAILAAHGQVQGGEKPKSIPLMYPIRKTIDNKTIRFKEAYFSSVFFTILPDQIASLDQILRSSPLMLRHLIIELPARLEEPPIRPREISPSVTTGDVSPEVSEMSRAEMDREIDELLAVTPQA